MEAELVGETVPTERLDPADWRWGERYPMLLRGGSRKGREGELGF